MKIQTVAERVRNLLQQYPAARGDDTFLCRVYWHEYEKEFLFKNDEGTYAVLLPKISLLTKPSVIERVRRMVQEQAIKSGNLTEMSLLLPDEERVLKKRRIHQQNYIQFIRQKKQGKEFMLNV